MKIHIDEFLHAIRHAKEWGDVTRSNRESDARLAGTPLAKEIDSLKAKRDALNAELDVLRATQMDYHEINMRIKPNADAQLVVENAAAQIEDLISVLGEEYPGKHLSPQMWEQAHELIEKWHSHVMREVRILSGILGAD